MRAVLLATFSLACAAPRARLGELSMRRYSETQVTSPKVFSIQHGRILSPDLDAEVGADGCINALFANDFVHLCCPNEGGAEERWMGSGGSVIALERVDDGSAVHVEGFVRAAGGTMNLHTTLHFGVGPHWDELRRHPALFALAAAATSIPDELSKAGTQPEDPPKRGRPR